MPVGARAYAHRSHRRPCSLFILLLLVLLVGTGSRSSAEERSGPPVDGLEPAQTLPAQQKLLVPIRPTTAPQLIHLMSIPLPAGVTGGRPSFMIDGGSPMASPTEAELLKLEIARARIERARLAGTLYRVHPVLESVEPLPPDWEARKLARMRAQAPKPFPDDAAAGVGPMPSVQKRGPAGLTPAEEAKLRQSRPSSKDTEPDEGGR